MAYGDGVTFYVATKQGDGTVNDVVTTPPDVDKWMKAMETTAGKPWKERLVLKFAIPQIPVLGLWEFSTHANNSTIPNIIGTIDTVYEMAGRLAGIPFDLIIEKVKSDKAGSKSVYPVVTMVCNISQESAALVRELPMQVGAMLTEQRIAQLASGEHQPQQKESEPFTEYEDITEPPTPAAYIAAAQLNSPEQFTYLAGAIAKMIDKAFAKSCAELLGDEAQKRGYRFSREKKAYEIIN